MKNDLTYALDVLNYARRARRHLEGKSYADFAANELLQDAVLRCFEVMGEATKRLSRAFRAAHPAVDWRGMAGLRDVLIHGYDGIDYRKCWEICQDQLPTAIEALERIVPPEN